MKPERSPGALSAMQGGPRRLLAPAGGSARGARSRSKPRTRGARAAFNRYRRMRAGLAGLPPHKDELLRLTGRLVVHCENASDRLFREGELTADGDVRQLVPRVIDLVKQVRENVVYIDGDDGRNPAADLAALFRKDGDGA